MRSVTRRAHSFRRIFMYTTLSSAGAAYRDRIFVACVMRWCDTAWTCLHYLQCATVCLHIIMQFSSRSVQQRTMLLTLCLYYLDATRCRRAGCCCCRCCCRWVSCISACELHRCDVRDNKLILYTKCVIIPLGRCGSFNVSYLFSSHAAD